MTEPYPLLLERHLSRRLWGGTKLAGFLELAGEEGREPLAESWQVYSDNRVLNGIYRGSTLAQVAEKEGASLLGTASVARYGIEFVPLMAKFIDAAQPLSIQVHPPDEFALTVEAGSGHLGKAEAWYILDCEPGAQVIWGFREPISPEQVTRAVESGTLEEHLNFVPVAPGDVVYNPPGSVHAIGGGIFLFEIQQASDLTYRLYDYGRRDSEGRLRELHLDRALQVAKLEPGRHPKVVPLDLGQGRRLLVECPFFVMEDHRLSGTFDLTTSPASLELLTVYSGELTLQAREHVLALRSGQSAVLPAALGGYTLEGSAGLVRCCVPL